MALEDDLGQSAMADEVFGALGSGRSHLVRLTGPPGSGKSHIAQIVAGMWTNAEGSCVIGIGDSQHAARDLYPFLTGLRTVPRDWGTLATSGSRAVLVLGGNVVGTGGAAASVFDLLASVVRRRSDNQLRPYNVSERNIISDLSRMTRSKNVLLIAENAHWWDSSSLWLLHELLFGPLRTAVPGLERLSVLLVDTAEEQGVVATDKFDRLLQKCRDATWSVKRCTRRQFSHVLRDFGLPYDPPDDLVDALYSASGGHLALTQQVVAYARHNSLSELTLSYHVDYLSKLLSERLRSLGSLSDDLGSLLAKAAVIGLTFQMNDLVCLARDLDTHVPTLIRYAEDIDFLRRDAEQISFTHDVLRSIVLREQSLNSRRSDSSRFAECLKSLRPGDYMARAEMLLQAGEREAGRESFGLACVALLRTGVEWSRVETRLKTVFPEDPDLIRFLRMMSRGYSSVAAGNFKAMLPELRTPVATESQLMAAERSYLFALCSMELQTDSGFSDAVETLKAWHPAIDEAADLNLRYLLLLQQALVLSESFEEARDVESRVLTKLSRRVRYDVDAVVMLQIQNRRAAAINVPEIAERRIAEAVEYFRTNSNGSARIQIELYRALNNLAAIQIRLGRPEDAFRSALEAQDIVLEPSESFPRLDILANNLVLAGVRSGTYDNGTAADLQELILESGEGGSDTFIQRCNFAAYLLLAGRGDRAKTVLTLLSDEARNTNISETYLLYYLSALLVAEAALSGSPQEAIELHRALGELVAGLRWPCAPYVRRRQGLITSRMFADATDPPTLDRALLTVNDVEIGPAWDYYARLIPCCELSFWSDS